jgi:Mg-chelatase subunit ChlD
LYDDNLNAPAGQKTELGRMRELKKDSFVGGDAISTDGTSAYAYNLNAPITLGEELKKQVADEDRDALSKNLPRRAGSYGLSIQPSAGQNLRRDLEVAKNGKASFSETAQTATEGTSDLNVNGSTVVSGGAMTVPAPHVINQPPPATLAFNRSGGGGYGGGGGMGGMGGKMGGASVSGGRGGGGSGGAIGNQSGGAQAGSFSTRLDGFVNGSQPAEQQLTSGLRSSGARQDRSPASDKDVKLKAGEPSYKSIETKQKALAQLEGISVGQKIAPTESEDRPAPRLAPNAPMPQPEMLTHENAFSTFSLNVADVSFKLAAASLDKGVMPDPSTVRSEEFINAFDYRDPEPAAGAPVAFAWERARYPFAHNRDLLRFSVKTAALGRQAGRPLNVVLLLDNSGSMERADRVRIIHESLRVLASQLKPEDRLSVVTFSRTSRLWVDGVPGNQAAQAVSQVDNLTPQGGTNLEEAMNLAYETALRHYQAGGVNRVVLLTDGAANLGNVDPDALKQKVESHRKQGVALDCFGIGWEGYNDDLLESLSRNGDGRYGFINTPEAAATEFAGQLAGALHVAASDVKVQVEFNPARVTAWRQIGYAKHQLKKEQFRDNTVDAAEIAAQEAGNALYTAEVNPAGEGPLAVVRLRYKVPGTTDYREQEWTVPFTGNAPALEQSGTAMRLAASAGAFAEWLVSSPFSGEVTPDRLLALMRGVPEVYGADNRPRQLETMIREAKSISGK